MLAEAAEEGILDHNPAAVVKVPSGRDALDEHDGADLDEDEDDPTDGRARALSRAQLATFLAVVHPDWRLMFELLAVTGGADERGERLRWQDLVLDGSHPHVRVRRSYVAPRFGPPKSPYGKRDVPIAFEMADRLSARRARAEFAGQRDLVFPSQAGTPLRTENVCKCVLKPAGEEAGCRGSASTPSGTPVRRR
jgi:integrase